MNNQNKFSKYLTTKIFQIKKNLIFSIHSIAFFQMLKIKLMKIPPQLLNILIPKIHQETVE